MIIRILRSRIHGLLRLRPVESNTYFSCLKDKCGLCCKVFSGRVTVAPNEIKRFPNEHLINYKSYTCLKYKQGQCIYLDKNLCQVYTYRPKSCREYPWYNVQGKLYVDIGCPGVNSDIGNSPPNVSSISPIEDFYTNYPPFVSRIIIRLLKYW